MFFAQAALEKEDSLYKISSKAQFLEYSPKNDTTYWGEMYTTALEKWCLYLKSPKFGTAMNLTLLKITSFHENRQAFKNIHLSQKLLRQPPFFFSDL